MTIDAASLRATLAIPDVVDVSVQRVQEFARTEMLDLPLARQLIEYQTDLTQPFMQFRWLEIDYVASYRVGSHQMRLVGNTYIVAPVSPGMPGPLITHLTGSMSGIHEFFDEQFIADPEACLRRSIECFSAPLMSYLFQLPVHVICKGGPGVRHDFDNESAHDPIGRAWTRCHAEQQAAKLVLTDAGFDLSSQKTVVGGISRGGFHALLLAAFDSSISHLMAVAGVHGFCEWSGLKDGKIRLFDRPDLLEKGIDVPQIFALIQAHTQVMFALNDGEIRPMHIPLLRQTNALRQAAGRHPLELRCFQPLPGRRGHSWPLYEAVNFYGNALWSES